jgi:hypothetical protein
MIFRLILTGALRFFSGAALAVLFALALALACSFLIGGWVPATILGVFLCASCQAVLPAAGLLLCAFLAVRLAPAPMRVK